MADSYAPIVLFVYNRPWHTEQTLNALSINELAAESVLFVFSDGPKPSASQEDVDNIARVRQVIRSKPWCKKVVVIESEQNKGLAGSIVDGVTRIVNEYGNIIVLEDDVVTSKGFLRFMNDALVCYADEPRVMHISGYMYPHREKLPETFFFNVPYPGGGWGTWARAWKNLIKDTIYLYNYFNTAWRWKKFNKFGSDHLQRQLVGNYNGTLKTWFIKWHATLLIEKGFTLYPGHSLTNNIGFDNSGSHCSTMNKFDVHLLAENILVAQIPLFESREARKLILRFYNGTSTLRSTVYSLLTFIIKKETVQKGLTIFRKR